MIYYTTPKEDFKVVSLDEIRPFVRKAGHPTKELIALVWLTGARIGELLKLTKESFVIDHANHELRVAVPTFKRGDNRLRDLIFDVEDPFIKDILIPRINSLGSPKDELFSRGVRTYELRLEKLNKRIYGTNHKDKWIQFHYLRHSRITWMARHRGLSPWEIQSWTGHKRLSSLDDYVIPEATKAVKGHFSES